MAYDYALLEQFFRAKFVRHESQSEMLFEATGMRYRLWIIEEHSTLVLTGDPQDPLFACPAIDIGTEFDSIRQTEALNVGPVLLFGLKNKIRLSVLRMADGRISISPNWNEKVKF